LFIAMELLEGEALAERLRWGALSVSEAMPIGLGVLPGAMAGSRLLVGAKIRRLRLVFSIVVAVLGFEMLYKGLTGRL